MARRLDAEHAHDLKVPVVIAGGLDTPGVQVLLNVAGGQTQARGIGVPALEFIRRDIGQPLFQVVRRDGAQTARRGGRGQDPGA